MTKLQFSTLNNQEIIAKLSQDDRPIFNHLVEVYYVSLCRTAIKYVRYEEPAEEIVQDVFVSLWEKRQTLKIKLSLAAYLHTAVKYRSINYLKSESRKPSLDSNVDLTDSAFSTLITADQEIAGNELQALVQAAIKKLPPKCRAIFDLSRNGGLTYKEIAKELSISQKTVEVQVGIALSRVKEYLNQHWENLLLIFLITPFS